jgi:hypothetical protein
MGVVVAPRAVGGHVASNVIRLGIEQLPGALKSGEKRFEKALSRGLRIGAERGRGILVKLSPTDLGQLRASWKVKADEWTSELINDAPHAGIVELGARPHKVSAEGWAAIYEWVRRHPEMYGQTKARTPRWTPKTAARVNALGPFQGDDPEISSITWAIVKKINREGQKATFFVRDALENLRNVLVLEVEKQLARATAKGGE